MLVVPVTSNAVAPRGSGVIERPFICDRAIITSFTVGAA